MDLRRGQSIFLCRHDIAFALVDHLHNRLFTLERQQLYGEDCRLIPLHNRSEFSLGLLPPRLLDPPIRAANRTNQQK